MNPKELVALLVERGFSQERIARHAGTTQATISRMLRGVHLGPRFDVVEKIERFAKENNVIN